MDTPNNHQNATARLIQLANSYLKRLTFGIKDPDIKYVVDKMPPNFLHLSTIAYLFPNAKIIHCKRNTLDTCLSNYFQKFSAGNPFANNLEDLAHFCNLYEDEMVFYKETITNKIYELEYEALTNNTQEEVRKLLEYLELPFDENCIHPENSKSLSSTASGGQVKQPIYKTSQQRWRKYEKHLQPLIKALNNPPC